MWILLAAILLVGILWGGRTKINVPDRTFRFADNEADGNLSFLEKEGYVHDGTASDEYTYNGLGFFWNPHEGGKLYCRDGTR